MVRSGSHRMVRLHVVLLFAGASALVPLSTPVGLSLRSAVSPRALAVARYGSSSSKPAKVAKASPPTRRGAAGKSGSKPESTGKPTPPAGFFGRKPAAVPATKPAAPVRGPFGRKATPAPPPAPPAKPAGLFGFGAPQPAAPKPASPRGRSAPTTSPPSDRRAAQAADKAQKVAMRKAGLDVLKVVAQFSREKAERRKAAAAAAPSPNFGSGDRDAPLLPKFSMPKLELPT
eukprot:scaffold10557_cov187-Isochrysis_galbana.AAC.1